jgi:hypothetical protein
MRKIALLLRRRRTRGDYTNYLRNTFVLLAILAIAIIISRSNIEVTAAMMASCLPLNAW